MRIQHLLLFVCCLLPLLTLNSSVPARSGEQTAQDNLWKISDELKAVNDLHPNESHLVYIDLFASSLPNGDVVLPSSDLFDLSESGARIAGITYSADRRSLWCLAEVDADQLFKVINLPAVGKASLAPSDKWDWWNRCWYKETNIEPILVMAAQRMLRDFPEDKIEVVINYEASGRDHEKRNSQVAIDEIKMEVDSLGGDLEKVGMAEYVLAKVYPTMVSMLARNPSVKSLEAVRPAATRDGPRAELKSGSSGMPLLLFSLFFLLLVVVGRPSQEFPKVKSRLLLLLLLSSFLFSGMILPAKSLDISRQAIRADKLSQTGRGITVAIIDKGVDDTHPDLAGAFVAEVDLAGHNVTQDYSGHGTHVAGIVASRSEVYRGIAPDVQLINLHCLDTLNVRDALQWCIDHRTEFNIRVIQMSVGEPTEMPDGDGMDPLSMKADDAVDSGMVVVVAMFDHGEHLSSPEQAYNVIAVGSSLDKDTVDVDDDSLASISSHGPTGDGRPKPDILAPGGRTENPQAGIWSARSLHALHPEWYEAIDGDYGRLSGTSMAAPHVSGTVALMLEANPNLTPAQVKAILRQTAKLNDNLDGLSVNDRGHGIIDAFDAVQAAITGSVNIDQVYDSWAASTPTHDLPYYCYDYLTFTVSPPSSKGISMENIDYHLKWFGVPITEYRLLKQEYVRDIWIDGTYHNLGDEMGTHLLSGPRVYEKGPGYLKLRAKYLIGSVSVVCYWDMTQNGQDFWIEYAGGSSWKTLIVINPEIWGPSNYAFLGNYGPTVLLESRIADLPYFYIRSLGSDAEYLKIFPEYSIYTAWLLKHGYTGTNPNEDLALNSEYIYNRDLDLYIQMDCQSPAVAVLRVTDSPLPAPANHQNDAGSGGDAGNSFGYATYVNPGSYTGILCNSDPSDTQDWYQFYVDSGLTVIVYVIPPRGIDFDLELYDQSYQLKSSSHNGPGIPEAVGIDNCQAGWWRARIYTISGEAQYSFSVSIKEASTPRCPYVFTWDGQRYVIDNNLLPTSLKNNGTDVEDYYKLEQPLVPTYQSRSFSLYKLQISEFENEHSYIDQVRLLAVDHSGDCNIAVTPEGEIVTYGQPQPPISCVDNNGTNRLSQTQLIDGNVSDPSTYFDGYKGDYLVVNFGQVTSQNAKLILRSDRKCYNPGLEPPCCIQVQILNNSQWQTVSVLAPREYWATEAVNLSPYVAVGQDLTVRLYWTMPHRLDYVGLDATPQETFEIHYAQIVSATHNVEGSVPWKLQNNDEVYAELVPGQQIRLTFLMPNAQNQNEERTFIFYTEGHYNIIA